MEIQEIKFPITFDKCPNCESERKLANEVLNQEKEKGKIGLEVSAFIFQNQSLIVDMRKTWFTAPMIITTYDVCLDCGTVYCIKVDVQTTTPQYRKPPEQGFSRS